MKMRRLAAVLWSMVLVLAIVACGTSGGDGNTEPGDAKQAGDGADVGGQCTPMCDELECGDDGCGGECGTCAGDLESCVEGICICQPACGDVECGSDGCGGVCGYCLDNEQCVEDFCICQPQCEDKECGPDGCGGFCGDCAGDQVMCVDGACLCQPVCLGKNCGDDGCDGSCGECDCGETCGGGSCQYTGCDGRECGDDGCGVSCGDCTCGETCDEGLCIFHACDGLDCGDDDCGGSCGQCPQENDQCLEGLCQCIPGCDGKVCGDDGCGGLCGECDEGVTCALDGLCAPACSPVGLLSCGQLFADDTSLSTNVYSSYGCLPNEDSGPELSYLFTPNFDGEVVFSVSDWDGWDPDVYLLSDPCGKDECLAFGESGITFEVVAGTVYYVVVDGYNGTMGSFTLSAQCACDTDCEGKECGVDGCGGECGVCPVQHECQDNLCVCIPDCVGKQCGPDGCGGDCGECLGICEGGLCHLGPGCEEAEIPFCADCDCQECVCALDAFCCDVAWDELCVGECIDDCGGCAVMDDCDDAVCEGYESCINCPGDCACEDPAVCWLNACCEPWCGGMNCGDDGCGGTCGDCGEDAVCTDGVCLVLGPGCVPTLEVPGCGGCDCEECVCELDAWCCTNEWDSLCVGECTNDCGSCQIDADCGNLLCEPGEDCGLCPDDCPCASGHWCNEFFCEEGECPTQCEGLECGDDGCDGVCGICPDEKPWCFVGLCFEECQPACEGKTCGDDGCDGVCGECAEGEVCPDGNCCSPWCGGMNCGDDGCGGVCGECAEGDECTEGVCLTPNTDPGCVPTPDVLACAGCACQECVCLEDPFCCDTEWDTLCVGLCIECGFCAVEYECGNGLCEPGEDCGACPDDCPCVFGTACAEGACEPCEADCTDKVCGDDSCQGSCGECDEGFICSVGICMECDPDCTDKACGDDGCGGSCGSCEEGIKCIDFICAEPIQ